MYATFCSVSQKFLILLIRQSGLSSVYFDGEESRAGDVPSLYSVYLDGEESRAGDVPSLYSVYLDGEESRAGDVPSLYSVYFDGKNPGLVMFPPCTQFILMGRIQGW